MKIICIFSCSGMFQNVPCSWFYRHPKLTTFSAPYDHVLIMYCLSFQVFSWECILFLKSARVNMVMQIQVQIGDTRRVFFVNPRWSVEDLKSTTFLREIPKTCFIDFGILYEND